jgi:hypothetical protein
MTAEHFNAVLSGAALLGHPNVGLNLSHGEGDRVSAEAVHFLRLRLGAVGLSAARCLDRYEEEQDAMAEWRQTLDVARRLRKEA